MRVLLIANYLPDAQESMQRFVRLMARGLERAGHQVRVCRPQPLAGRLRARGTTGKWLGYIDKFGVFPMALHTERHWADVAHICDHSNSMYVSWLCRLPHVVTCHDVLAIRSAAGAAAEHRTGWKGRQLQRLIRHGLEKSRHVVCVSGATRDELLQRSSVQHGAVSVIPNGVDSSYSPLPRQDTATRLQRIGLEAGKPFVLHVGGNQWYKNRGGVLKIFSALRMLSATKDFHLVMAGKPLTQAMRAFVREHSLGASVLELTHLADEDLRALYSSATMLLFPSLYEGFGWPILEAQACGCPVATSNRAPMNEVAGGAAVYVDPEAPEQASRAIADALPLLGELGRAGIRNASQYSETAMIESYVDLYRRL